MDRRATGFGFIFPFSYWEIQPTLGFYQVSFTSVLRVIYLALLDYDFLLCKMRAQKVIFYIFSVKMEVGELAYIEHCVFFVFFFNLKVSFLKFHTHTCIHMYNGSGCE